jgi:hypothetical protein
MPAPRPRPARAWLAAACLGLALLAGGCGRKMLPIQPGALPPPRVVDLRHQVQDGAVELSWSQPGFSPNNESAAAGFRVQRSRQTAAEAECRTCPAPFQTVADIPAAGRRPGSRVRFRETLEPGFVYRFRVQAYSADGVEGRESGVVVVSL